MRARCARTTSILKSSAYRAQRLVEIRDQVRGIVDIDRQTNQRCGDAERYALIRRNRGVSHETRMIDETLDAAEALGNREDLEPFEETLRLLQSSLHEKRDDPAETVLHLTLRQLVLRMARQSRIEHARDVRLTFE